MTREGGAPLDKRSQFIPARKIDLFHALTADLLPACDETEASQLYRLLTAIFHFEYLDDLERLHAAYYHLDPGRPGGHFSDEETETAYLELAEAMDHVLRGANFVEISSHEVTRAARDAGKLKYTVSNGVADFRAVRLFRRGHHSEEVERKSLFGLRKWKVHLEVYDEVVLLAALKPEAPDGGKRKKRPPSRPGSVVIKLFHDIPSADLDALYPEVRVVMTLSDKLMFGLPALFGGIPLLIKLAPAFLVLYGLLRYYAGDKTPETSDGISEALIVAGGIIALGGFMMQQWVKYERRALRYQKEVNDLVYFHNVTNNVGLFDHLIGIAEEQECKEALLAYFFLLTASAPMRQPELDAAIEVWLQQRFALHLDFEVDDALAKLDRLGLLIRDGETLTVQPLPGALRELDRRWDGFFQFAHVA